MKKEYKTELHCHSRDVSPCSNESAERIVEKYLRYGYNTIVLTNHLSDYVLSVDAVKDKSWKEKADYFIEGYRKLKNAAEGKELNILLGAEIRFPQNSNDYLFFGFDEDYLYNNEDIYQTNVGAFHTKIQNDGYLLIQAHPFRPGMYIVNPWDVDGWEVYNGHPRQVSSNRVALEYAKQYPHKHQTSGSDHHDTDHFPDGGIITNFEITTNKQLVEVLHSGDYTLIEEEEIRLGNKRL